MIRQKVVALTAAEAVSVRSSAAAEEAGAELSAGPYQCHTL
jgi:hypothetical protein